MSRSERIDFIFSPHQMGCQRCWNHQLLFHPESWQKGLNRDAPGETSSENKNFSYRNIIFLI